MSDAEDHPPPPLSKAAGPENQSTHPDTKNVNSVSSKVTSPDHRDRAKKDRLRTVGLIVAILTLVVGAIPAIFAITDRFSPPTEEAAVSPSPSSPQSGNTGATVPDGDAPAGCYIETGPTSCNAKHSTERVSLEQCTRDGLIRFMGGNSDTDIIRSDLSIESGEGMCIISGIGTETHQSLSGILEEQAGDAYRSCWDRQTDQELACSRPHFAEKFYEGGPEEVDCKQHYESYVGHPYERDDLEIDLEFSPGSSTTCWAKVRGDNLLSGSLRNLGDQDVPF